MYCKLSNHIGKKCSPVRQEDEGVSKAAWVSGATGVSSTWVAAVGVSSTCVAAVGVSSTCVAAVEHDDGTARSPDSGESSARVEMSMPWKRIKKKKQIQIMKESAVNRLDHETNVEPPSKTNQSEIEFTFSRAKKKCANSRCYQTRILILLNIS